MASSEDFLTQRYDFYDRYDKWRDDGLVKHIHWATPHHLANLLGFRHIDHLMDDGDTDEVIHTLKLLNGPNGLTVYKMLMIKRGFK